MTIEIPPGVRGLVFDCDGTIADTMPLHYRAWREALGEHGQDFPEALFYQLGGIPTIGTIEVLNDRHGYRLPVRETAEKKERLYEALIPQVKPIAPVVALVHRYAGQLPMAVATGATKAICEPTLRALDLWDYFAAVVTADDVKRGKPAPDTFLVAAERLGLDPKDCCAFEDATLGIESARAAGMTVIDIRPFAK